jgi:glycosyltransferase involved in cell wall biosynthesis
MTATAGRALKIAYITSGAAGMFCGSCMHDNTLAAALIAQGHDCLLIPTYTPIRTDEPDVSLRRVFFGGITVYLEQHYRLFRRIPRALNWLLSRPALLRWVSRFGIKTRPEELGDLTVSMLRGVEGYQRDEVFALVRWLVKEVRPDVVCLTNVLISGMVPELKARLGVPVLCTLQGDDIYLDWLPARHREECLRLITQNGAFLDGYLTTSRYYADFMTAYLGIPRDKIDVVYPGINLTGYEGPAPSGDGPLTVGYLARICPEKGLHVLVEAFDRLKRRPGLPPCRLRAAGYLGPRDQPYLADLRARVAQQGWAADFEYVGEVDHAGKVAFLRGLDVFSVPTTYREPKGLYLLEAWACGLPAVQPRHGSFPELTDLTGGGLLVEPQDPDGLADGLERLLLDVGERRKLGESGRAAVRQRFHAAAMAESTAAVFRRYLEGVPALSTIGGGAVH